VRVVGAQRAAVALLAQGERRLRRELLGGAAQEARSASLSAAEEPVSAL